MAEDRTLPRIDTSRAHPARIYESWLGGKDNFAADREAAELALQAYPELAEAIRSNRAFLGRAVRFLVGAGIRQFLDVGTGLPAGDNTHEVAQREAPDSRIVYVDNDPIVLRHAQALLTSTPQGACDYLQADLRDPEKILAEAARTLDLGRPVSARHGRTGRRWRFRDCGSKAADIAAFDPKSRESGGFPGSLS